MITPIMTITEPFLFTPKMINGKLKYSCSLLIEKSDKDGINKLRDVIQAAIQEGRSTIWNNKIPEFRYKPLLDGDDVLKSGKEMGLDYKGRMFLYCSSTVSPEIVTRGDQGLRFIVDPDANYTGRHVRADIYPFPFQNKNGCGIGWQLNGLLLINVR